MPEAPPTIRATTLPPVLRRFRILFVALTLLSELWSAVGSLVFHRRPPYGGTFSWDDAGQDLLIFRPLFPAFHTAHFWDPGPLVFTYPAPLVVVYWLAYHIPHLAAVYLALGIAILAAWAWYFAVRFAAFGISRNWAFVALLAFLAMAWPVRMLLQTGNLEMLVALALGVGIVAAVSGRWTLGASLIGIAASMKIYPFMLLGLMLAKRRYRAFAWGIATAALVTVASLAILGPSILEAQRHIGEGISFLKELYVLAPVPYGLQFSHSLFNLVKIAVVASDRMHHTLPAIARPAHEEALIETALKLYTPVVATLGLALYVVRLRHLPALNQVIALTVCAVLLPPFSLDYTLVQLLVPMGLLCVFALSEWRKGYEPAGLNLCFACFAILFSTGAYFELKYRFAAQARTLALIVLLAAVCRYRFERRAEPGNIVGSGV